MPLTAEAGSDLAGGGLHGLGADRQRNAVGADTRRNLDDLGNQVVCAENSIRVDDLMESSKLSE
jgi:hypothetical protein